MTDNDDENYEKTLALLRELTDLARQQCPPLVPILVGTIAEFERHRNPLRLLDRWEGWCGMLAAPARGVSQHLMEIDYSGMEARLLACQPAFWDPGSTKGSRTIISSEFDGGFAVRLGHTIGKTITRELPSMVTQLRDADIVERFPVDRDWCPTCGVERKKGKCLTCEKHMPLRTRPRVR